jgi:hypothetical protein
MTKRDMKKALGATLKAEERAVKSRFENAKTVPGKEQPKPKETDQVVSDSFTLLDSVSRIKQRCMKAGITVSESDVLRVGVAALDAMGDRKLARSFESLLRVPTRKPRRLIRIVGRREPLANADKTPKPLIKSLHFARRLMMGRRVVTVRWSAPLN